MRLLQCFTCKTVDELPDYDGPPEQDFLLDHILATKHSVPDGAPEHMGALHNVETEAFKANKQEILKEMWSKTTGFQPEYYDSRNTYQDDAAKCWTNEHSRPTFCADFRTDKKRIQNPTKEGWKSKDPKAAVYLCDFCVVRTNVMSYENSKRP